MTRYDPEDPTARVVIEEVEVPASPEEVWRAIATGPGIEAWFVPAEVEGREGGAITTHHGPFGDSDGVVTAWEPPSRFAYEERDWNPEAPDAPPWATEILVEARGGGSCVVRLVSGFFTGGEGWEEMLEGTPEGWRAALRTLRLYLEHHAGLPTASMMEVGTVPGELEVLAASFLAALDLDGAAVGDRVTLAGDAPATAGVVEEVLPTTVAIRTDEPMPGVYELGVWPFDQPTAVVRAHLYGDGGDEVAERVAEEWRAWLHAHVEGYSPMG